MICLILLGATFSNMFNKEILRGTISMILGVISGVSYYFSFHSYNVMDISNFLTSLLFNGAITYFSLFNDGLNLNLSKYAPYYLGLA